MPRRYNSNMDEFGDYCRKEMRRLVLSRDTIRLSSALMSIIDDYLNYRYEMSRAMAMSILRKLREQPERRTAGL